MAPLKTALSHGFIGLGASKTGAKKGLAGRAAGDARVRGNAEKARAKCGKGAEGIQKMAEKCKKCVERAEKGCRASAEKARRKAEKGCGEKQKKGAGMRGRAKKQGAPW